MTIVIYPKMTQNLFLILPSYTSFYIIFTTFCIFRSKKKHFDQYEELFAAHASHSSISVLIKNFRKQVACQKKADQGTECFYIFSKKKLTNFFNS